MIFKSFLVINLLLVLISASPTPSVKILGKSKSNVLFRDASSGDDSNSSEETAQLKPKWKNLGERSSTERKSKSTFQAKTCGYESCPKVESNMLNVHLVAHTHDDVGWLKTVDQYYYGSKSLIQKAGVQYIIDSVVQALLKDPAKKFIYVESAFFHKWWKEQTPELQDQVKMLVSEGRLEFINGAWSMNDEATTHYQSIIDQFSWGLRFLNETFGECGRPKIGWQIDPFGHAREQASLFAQMGYDGMFFGRLDYEDKQQRMTEKKMEMIWKGSANLGEAGDLFTGALYNNYSPPPGFCFDILCSDEPIIDDKFSPDYNVDRRVDQFMRYIGDQSEFFRTNNIILTMGGDFTFMDANFYYKNLDKLIRYSNERQSKGSKVNVFYSTPSCYLKSLHESNITWPTKSDDFFPYSSDPHSFWTGYFTSRPTIKRFERVGNHFLQICKQLSTMAPVQESHFTPHLNILREAMGIMQHHDAVTGTEKQKVAEDYSRLLTRAMKACEANTKSALNQFITGKVPTVKKVDGKYQYKNMDFDYKTCLNLNVSACDVSENSLQFTVILYNPLAHSMYQHVRVPVSGDKYIVKDYKGIEVPTQIVPIPASVLKIQYRNSNAVNELVFLANELPPLGYKSYFITKISNTLDDFLFKPPEAIQLMDEPATPTSPTIQLKPKARRIVEKFETVVIGNEYLNVSFDVNGLVSEITVDGVTSKLGQNFVFYEGAIGNNEVFENRSSGAYIFRPRSNIPETLIAKEATLQVVKGDLVDEVHQIFNEWISQVVRVYKTEKYVEFEWLVGPIPIADGAGKEIVSRFYSTLNSSGVCYTDSNGREMLKRTRNHRDTFTVHLKEPIAGNYYPVTTKIAIEDDTTRMAVLTDRAQGGGSMYDGTLELMIHRRLLHDDAFGVGEALNETAFGKGLIARGKHYLFFGAKNTASPTIVARERFLQNEILLPNWLFFSDVSPMDFNDWVNKYTNIHSAIYLSLPRNVYLMSLEPWRENEVLVRFEHILEKDDDPELSKPARFNFGDVFRGFDVASIKEVTLAGNQWIEDAVRFKFQPDPTYSKGFNYTVNQFNHERYIALGAESSRKLTFDVEVVLTAMQIRTFILVLNPKG